MQSILFILLGIFIEFFFGVVAGNTNKKAGDECGGDCGKCTAHCVGYHCYLVRRRQEEDHTSTEEG